MTDVLIDRELLERAWRQLANYDTGKMIGAVLDAAPCDPGCAEICVRASMCATCMADMEGPRQPEGEGLEVVARLGGNGFHTEEKEATGAPFPLCHLSDAQRAIAELREECNTLRQQLAERDAELKKVKADRASCWAEFKVMTRSCLGAEKERDNLRQQLAERDAQIASMRAEVTPFIETHWRPVARQRDKLAGLLLDALKLGELDRVLSLRTKVMAALAEIENTQ